MANGATFEINVEAKSLGIDSSAAQLTAFAQKLQNVDTVATQFDAVVAAASARLEETSVAAKLASDALAKAETKYTGLEAAANRTAKAVEKAAAAGKDTTALKVAAEEAAVAMRAQSSVVDALAVRSRSAATEQTKLAAALKTLQGRQSSASDETKKANAEIEKNGRVTFKMVEGHKTAAVSANKSAESVSKFAEASKLARLGALAVGAAVVGSALALGAFAVASNPAAMMRLNLISQRLHLSFVQLFRGLKLDGFLTSIQKFAALFEQSNASGRALKVLIETIFQPLFDAAAKLEPYIGEAFKGLIHGALLVVIAVLTLRNAIFKAMSPELRAEIKGVVDKIFTLENAFKLGGVAASVLAVAVGVAAIAMAGMIIDATILAAPFVAVGVAIYFVIDAWNDLMKQWDDDSWDTLVDGASDAASDMIDGIVDGIKNGAKWVYDAIKDLATGAVDKFKSTLGIHSPSTVFALQGMYTAAGYVEGVEDGTPAVHSALASMASPADVGSGTSAGSAGGTSTSNASTNSRSIHIEHLTIGGGSVAQSTFGDLKRALLEVLEGASLTIGGGEAPAT